MSDFTSDVVIGLEIHIELDLNSKLFCRCMRGRSNSPNSSVCPICLGHPGALPLLNKKAIEFAVRLGLVANSKISDRVVFSRKNYFYPDLSKNFQTTQFELPICDGGFFELSDKSVVDLIRIHIEEDPSAILYPDSALNSQFTLLDYNRSGNALLELVTSPCISSASQAREFLKFLSTTLSYLEIFDESSCVLKCDVNVSVKESNYTRVEVKNISSFKDVETAIILEVQRQKSLCAKGLKIENETRGFVGDSTISLRSKESEADYAYIVEPDLPSFFVSDDFVSQVRNSLPELSESRRLRYIDEWGIEPTTAKVISDIPKVAFYFEKVSLKIDPVLASNWIRRDLLRVLNDNSCSVEDLAYSIDDFVELLVLVKENKINNQTAQKVFDLLVEKSFSPKVFVEKNNLISVSDDSVLIPFVRQVIDENPKAVSDFLSGEDKALKFLIGKVMQLSKGRADPKQLPDLLKDLLSK